MKDVHKNDEELQRMIFESQSPSYMDGDAEIYDKIKFALTEPPAFHLESNFAESVTKEAVKRKALHATVGAVLFKAAVTFAILIIGAAAFYFISKEVFGELAALILNFKYQLLFALALLSGIQIMDKLLLRKEFGDRTSGVF